MIYFYQSLKSWGLWQWFALWQEGPGLNSKVLWACGVSLFSPCQSGCSGFTHSHQNIYWVNTLHSSVRMLTRGRLDKRREETSLFHVFVTCKVDSVLLTTDLEAWCEPEGFHMYFIIISSFFHEYLSISWQCISLNAQPLFLSLSSEQWLMEAVDFYLSLLSTCSCTEHSEELKATNFISEYSTVPLVSLCCPFAVWHYSVSCTAKNSWPGMCCWVHFGTHFTTRKDKKSCGGHTYVC